MVQLTNANKSLYSLSLYYSLIHALTASASTMVFLPLAPT